MKTLTPDFGMVLDSLDLRNLSNSSANELRSILYQHKVLYFKDIIFTEPEFIEFAKKLGSIVSFVDEEYRHPDFPEIFVVSNLSPKDGKKIGMERVGYYWHSDSSFCSEPLPLTMLYCKTAPAEGGQTAFIDMTAVFNELPKSLQQEIETKVARHEGKWRYLVTERDLGLSIQDILERDEKELPSQVHPLVTTHPVTKQKALYLSEGITKQIVGYSAENSANLLQQLSDKSWNHPSKYVHKWNRNDFIIWDNRSVIHRAFPAAPGHDRLMHRIGVRDREFFELGGSS